MIAQSLSFIIAWVLILSANPSNIYAQRIINSTLFEGNVTCSGQTVVFTCKTRGSNGLAWSSDQYIGTDGKRILFAANDIISTRNKSANGNPNTYAILTGVTTESGEPTLTSELHIIASVSRSSSQSSVTCEYTDDVQRTFTMPFKVYALPGAPGNLVVSQVRYTRTNRCVITPIWQSPVNSVQAGVTLYTVRSNENFILNETVDSDTTEFSTSFSAKCTPDHMISVTANNICRSGPPAIYAIVDEGECSKLNIESVPPSCYITVAPPSVTPSGRGKSGRNSGNIIVVIVGGFVVMTTLLLG